MTLIQIENIGKTYGEGNAEVAVLKEVGLTIASGEFVSIMGPSGSGKSTLLHILGFLDRPSSGVYRFDGRTIDEHSDDELAYVRNRKMGFVFQAFNLLARASVLENVKLPLLYSGVGEAVWDTKARTAIEAVGLSHRLLHAPSELSGGERQRVAIARALVNEPSVIFADEPTGNLDSRSGKQVMEILLTLHERGHTIVMVTHETYTSRYAERIVHLLDGRITSDEKVAASERMAHAHFVK
jgi:putative ABC transport system ATP-binding protein